MMAGGSIICNVKNTLSLTSCTGKMVPILAAPFPIQLTMYVSGKAADHGPGTWVISTM